MTLWVDLRCAGKPGLSNGCAEGYGERGFGVEAPYGRDELRGMVQQLMDKAEKQGWTRSTKDHLYRCPACAALTALPVEIAGIPWAKWEEAIALYVAGEPPSKWGGKEGRPSKVQFNNALARYSELRERCESAPDFRRAQARKPRSTPLPEARWPTVLARFQAGEEKAAICTGEDGMWPTEKMWNGKMARDSAFRGAVNAEHHRRRQAKIAAIDWEAAVVRYQSGETLASVFSQKGMPDKNRWLNRRNEDPDFRDLSAAISASLKRAREAAKSARIAEQGKLARERAEPLGERLRTALRQNEIFTAVDDALPRGLPPHIRDDVMSTMVLAILEGEIDVADVRKLVGKYTRAYHRDAGTYVNVSMDAPVRGSDGLRLIDTFADDVEHF